MVLLGKDSGMLYHCWIPVQYTYLSSKCNRDLIRLQLAIIITSQMNVELIQIDAQCVKAHSVFWLQMI